MGERLKNYISYIDKILENPLSDSERNRLKENLIIQISFFQHERLIHLIVTATFAVLSLLTFFFALIIGQPALWVLLLLLLVLLIPYIMHYYKLENGVQKLYLYYDRVQ